MCTCTIAWTFLEALELNTHGAFSLLRIMEVINIKTAHRCHQVYVPTLLCSWGDKRASKNIRAPEVQVVSATLHKVHVQSALAYL